MVSIDFKESLSRLRAAIVITSFPIFIALARQEKRKGYGGVLLSKTQCKGPANDAACSGGTVGRLWLTFAVEVHFMARSPDEPNNVLSTLQR